MPLHEWLDVGRRDEPNLMPHRLQLTRPVMRTAARFHRDQARRLLREEVEQLRPAELPAEHYAAALVSAVRMKNGLGDIQPDCDSLRHGRLPQWCFKHLHSGTSMPSGGVHPISFRHCGF